MNEGVTAPVAVSVVIPVRNAEDFVRDCLASVLANRPEQVIVVDGGSTDRTLDIVRELAAADDVPVQVVDDGGGGVAGARMLGLELATSPVVALVDADIVLGRDTLARWAEEFHENGWVGLQADLEPESLTDGYWGRCLARHQRISRSRYWFGLCATLVDRQVMLDAGLDARFRSGEDIEFRHRMARAGARIEVSRDVVVRHRFRDGFDEALHQWSDDGSGLARLVRKNGLRELPALAVPAAGFLRGVALTLLRRPAMLPYWFGYLFVNYLAMGRTLLSRAALQDPDDPDPAGGPGEALGLVGNSTALAATRVLPMAVGFLSWTLAARAFEPGDVGLAAAAVTAAILISQVSASGHGQAVVNLLPRQPAGGRRMVRSGAVLAGVVGVAAGVVFAVVARRYATHLGEIAATASAAALFLALVLGTSLAYYYDHVAIARRRSQSALMRSVVQSACLLVATISGAALLGPEDGLTVMVAGAAGGALLSAVLGWARELTVRPAAPGGSRDGSVGLLVRAGAPHLALTLASRSPVFVLPFVVTELISPEANAAWYAAWMMAMAVWFAPNSVAYSLQARLARVGSEGLRRAEVAHALRSAFVLGAAAAVGVAVLGPVLLGVMGPVYETATQALWVLVATLLPSVFVEVWLAVSRARRKWALPILVHAGAGLLALTAVVAVAPRGLTELAVAWLAVQCLLGLAAAIEIARGFRAAAPVVSREPIREPNREPTREPTW